MRFNKVNFCLHPSQVSLLSAGVTNNKNQGAAVVSQGHPDRHEQCLVAIATSLFYLSRHEMKICEGNSKGGFRNSASW